MRGSPVLSICRCLPPLSREQKSISEGELGYFILPLYFIVGFAQIFAIMDWFKFTLDWGGLISFIAAFFLTYIPLIGSVLGVLGAHDYWGWSWFWSIALFFWYLLLFPVFLVIGMFGKR